MTRKIEWDINAKPYNMVVRLPPVEMVRWFDFGHGNRIFSWRTGSMSTLLPDGDDLPTGMLGICLRAGSRLTLGEYYNQ